QFFGRGEFVILASEERRPDPRGMARMLGNRQAFAEFARHAQPDLFRPMQPPDPGGQDTEKAIDRLLKQLGRPRKTASGESYRQALGEALKDEQVVDALREACGRAHSGTIRPTEV